MAKSLMDIIIDSIFDNEWVGEHGEKLTERELKLVKLFGRKGKTLRNVYIPKDNGETSEIDVVYITQKGVFVFESKNYSGWIFGDEKSQYWTAMLPNKLKKYVGEDIPLFSIIVLSERCELKKVEVASTDVKVIKRDRTYAAVREIWDSHEDAVEDVDTLYEKLKVLTNVDLAVKAAHIADIERKYKKTETENSTNSVAPTQVDQGLESEDLVCPFCGKALVLRTAKKGPNTGKQFYGCVGFPNCRYVRNMY